jgi:hypothetical protein
MPAKNTGQRRVPIPEALSAQILFESDRTCCVCRISGRKVEIHHIDGNPANNVAANLAVLCKDCHSDAHTAYAFARSLGPEIVRKYNETWREIVRLRLRPGGAAGDELEYSHQVLLYVYLAPYSWRNAYIDLYPGHFDEAGTEVHRNPWNHILHTAKHTYSDEEWRHYLPLFKVQTPAVIEELEGLVRTYGDALPASIKLQIARCSHGVRGEASGYFYLPRLVQDHPEHADLFMYRRFIDTLTLLQTVSELADSQMKAIKPPPPPGYGIALAA